MDTPDHKKIANTSLELGRLILAFGRVERTTYHEDGILPESDTTHTCMLATLACSVAHSYDTSLDVGKVAQYAIVHDLVEAYAGDVSTLGGISEDAQRTKEENERKALDRIHSEFDDVFPWIASTIEMYEKLSDKEARFVKTLDKMLPKITHILNDGKVLARHGMTKAELDAFRHAQLEKLKRGYGHDQDLVLSLMRALHSSPTAH